MPRSFNSVAVVAGGSAGVGRATVTALLDRGQRVAILARGKSRLDEIARRYGDRVWTRAVDVSDGAALETAGDAIVAEFGRPDVWVNSAMLTSYSPFAEVGEEEFRRITDTTYLGTVNGCRTALRIMREGNVVNVGSGLAYTSIPFQAAYCGAKHAVEGFTQALRIELARSGRRVTLSMVQLPAVNTPQFDWSRNRMPAHPRPAGTIYQPEVAAAAILRAIDTDAREVLVGGSVLQLMAANMLLPDLVERRLAASGVEMQQGDRPDDGGPDNLESPVADYPAVAHGGFDADATPSGMIVDGDVARKAALVGGAALLMLGGALLGRLTVGRGGASAGRIAAQDRLRPSPDGMRGRLASRRGEGRWRG